MGNYEKSIDIDDIFLGTGVIMQNTPSIHPPSHTMSSLSPIPPHSGSIITASNGEHLAKINTQLIQVSYISETFNKCLILLEVSKFIFLTQYIFIIYPGS